MSSSDSSPAPVVSRVARLAGYIASDALSPGDRAALRRLDPHRPPPMIWYSLLTALDWPRAEEPRALLLASGLAMGPGTHDPKTPFGKVLAQARIAPMRIEQLLSAQGPLLDRLLLQLLRHLAHTSTLAFDWVTVYQLTSPHAETRQRAADQVARAYFAAQKTIKEDA